MKNDKLYIVHIIECITHIEKYTAEGKEFFLADDKTYDAVLRKLQIMSESTQRLSDMLKGNNTTIAWREIAGFRNILVHDYLGDIDSNIVWSIIENMLPELKFIMKEELNKLEGLIP